MDPFTEAVEKIDALVANFEFPQTLTLSDESIHGLDWDFDEDENAPFVRIGWNLPDRRLFVELSNGASDELNSIRYYYPTTA